MYYFGKPVSSRKIHVFFGSMSLCCKYGFFSMQYPDDKISEMIAMKPTRGDCEECIKRFNKMCPEPKEKAA